MSAKKELKTRISPIKVYEKSLVVGACCLYLFDNDLEKQARVLKQIIENAYMQGRTDHGKDVRRLMGCGAGQP